MQQSEILNLTEAELLEEVENTQRAYSDLKMAHAVSPLENTVQLKELRKTLARLKTELTQRREN